MATDQLLKTVRDQKPRERGDQAAGIAVWGLVEVMVKGSCLTPAVL